MNGLRRASARQRATQAKSPDFGDRRGVGERLNEKGRRPAETALDDVFPTTVPPREAGDTRGLPCVARPSHAHKKLSLRASDEAFLRWLCGLRKRKRSASAPMR